MVLPREHHGWGYPRSSLAAVGTGREAEPGEGTVCCSTPHRAFRLGGFLSSKPPSYGGFTPALPRTTPR